MSIQKLCKPIWEALERDELRRTMSGEAQRELVRRADEVLGLRPHQPKISDLVRRAIRDYQVSAAHRGQYFL